MLAAAAVWCVAASVAGGPLLPHPVQLPARSENVSAPNLIYIKIPKAMSSTSAGVARRLAAHHGLNGVFDGKWISREPGLWAEHSRMHRVGGWMDQLTQPSFLFTVIREPADRCLSEYYHLHISSPRGPEAMRTGNTPEAKIDYLRNHCSNFYKDYLRSARQGDKTTVKEVMGLFDFIGSGPERFNASALMLAEKYGHGSLASDVLWVDSKLEAQLETMFPTHFVPRPPINEEPAQVLEYINGAFKVDNAWDYELFRRVNEKIDDWTSSAGAKANTLEYEGLIDRAYKECDTDQVCSHALDAFRRQLLEENNRDNMRDSGRAYQEEVGMKIPGGWSKLAQLCEGCYYEDQGCGFKCIDDLFGQ